MFAPGAGRFLAAFGALVVVAAALVVLSILPFSAVAVLALAFVAAVWVFLAWFLRDPERTPGPGIVSAADGKVRAVERDGDRWLVSVFMNVTDVHVNRLPLDARVTEVSDAGTGFKPAFRPDAVMNVQRAYSLATEVGPVEVVQITGVLARRLVSFVHAGSRGRKGDRFGMIILGSRVDVLLPAGRVAPAVQVGDRVRAGETTIARETP